MPLEGTKGADRREAEGMGTVFKFQDFSLTQILRESNCGEFRRSNTDVFFPFQEM